MEYNIRIPFFLHFDIHKDTLRQNFSTTRSRHNASCAIGATNYMSKFNLHSPLLTLTSPSYVTLNYFPDAFMVDNHRVKGVMWLLKKLK